MNNQQGTHKASKVKVRVVNASSAAILSRNKPDMSSKNAQANFPTKHTLREIVQGIFRGIGMLVMCFLCYNFALFLAAIIAGGTFFIFNEFFVKLTGLSAFTDVFQNLFDWACTHLTLSVTVSAILYIIGFLWFIYTFVMRLAEDIIGQCDE